MSEGLGIEVFGADGLTLAFFCAVAFAGFLCSSVFGIGGTMLLLPALITEVPAAEAIALVSPVMLVSNGLKVYAFRRHIVAKAAGLSMLTALPAAALGASLAGFVDERWLRLGIAGLIVGALGLERLSALRIQHGARGLLAWGVGIGAASGLCGAAGAPTALSMRGYGLVKEGFVGTISALAVGLQLAKLPAFWGAGLLTGERLPLSCLLAGVAGLSVPVGWRLLQHIDARRFRALLDGILFCVALWLAGGALF